MSTTSTLSPVETVKFLYAAFARGDIATILGALRDDVDWHVNVDLSAPGVAQVPTFRPCHGPRSVGGFFTALAETAEIHSFQPVSFLGGDREVAVRIVMEFTARPTGRRMKMESMHHFTFDASGKVARFVDFLDTLGDAAALGAIRAAN
jgi:ketosteroid isomerase-like protein